MIDKCMVEPAARAGCGGCCAVLEGLAKGLTSRETAVVVSDEAPAGCVVGMLAVAGCEKGTRIERGDPCAEGKF